MNASTKRVSSFSHSVFCFLFLMSQKFTSGEDIVINAFQTFAPL